MAHRKASPEFRWIPGTLPDADALKRLKEEFPRPREPMGEAWFMSEERRLYRELCDNDIRDVDPFVLHHALYEIASGTNSFGDMPEWRTWYHHILANLVEDAFKKRLDRWVEILITGFMVLYPENIQQPYEGFRQDVFDTLAVSSMHPCLWRDGEIVPGKSLLEHGSSRGTGWYKRVSGDLSGLLFFCLKYLPPEAIEAWVLSLLALPSRHYQAQFLLWLLATRDVLLGLIESPAKFPQKAGDIDLEWDSSFLVSLGARFNSKATHKFLPDANAAAFRATIARNLTQDRVFDWLLGFEEVPDLKAEVVDFGRDTDFLGMFDKNGRFALYDSQG